MADVAHILAPCPALWSLALDPGPLEVDSPNLPDLLGTTQIPTLNIYIYIYMSVYICLLFMYIHVY